MIHSENFGIFLFNAMSWKALELISDSYLMEARCCFSGVKTGGTWCWQFTSIQW